MTQRTVCIRIYRDCETTIKRPDCVEICYEGGRVRRITDRWKQEKVVNWLARRGYHGLTSLWGDGLMIFYGPGQKREDFYEPDAEVRLGN